MAKSLAGRRGVTLVELLVGMGIVALLTTLLVPAVSNLRARAQATECLSNLRQIGIALNGYLSDNHQDMPVLAAGRVDGEDGVETIDSLLVGYVDDAAVFLCPADPEIGVRTGSSYYWNPALNGQRATALNFLNLTEALTRIPVLSDKEGWHKAGGGPKVNILYADGHAGRGLDLVTGN